MTTLRFNRIAVIDIGKTNAKLVVVDSCSGAELAVRKTSNVVCPGPPYPHYDIEGLWAFILASLRELFDAPGFEAISITTHGASAALLNETGELALPVLDYEHEYPEHIRQAYDRLRPDFSQTGSPRLSGGLNLGAQLHFLKTTFADQFASVRTIMTYPQYWAWRLTGIAAIEATSLGCHTDLWNPRERAYSDLVATLGLEDVLPPLRSAFDTLGPVRPGLLPDHAGGQAPAVLCGIHDSNASLLAHLATTPPPFSVVSTGTWVISFSVDGADGERGAKKTLDPSRDTLINVDAYARPVASARFMGGREYELLQARLDPVPDEDILAALPSAIEHGVMLLPNLVYGSGPFPGRVSAWHHDEDASPAELWAAANLYLALMTETCLDLIGAAGPVVVEGPFASNPAYLHALASLTGREIIALPKSTGTSLGASLLAGHRVDAVKGMPIQGPRLQLESYRQTWHALAAD